MRRLFALTAAMAFFIAAKAQKENDKYLSLGIFNTQNAAPFGKFAGLFGEILHPGIEAACGKDVSVKQHHEWFIELKIGYFYHRYVQHAIPLYLNFGYRYRISDHFLAETSLGAGYLQSVPATAQLELENGDYIKSKGIGRIQAMTMFSLGLGYTPNLRASKPIRIFTAYRQMAQMPFVKSYVPLLPYSSFMIGISRYIGSK